MSLDPELSIIAVNWNSARFLRQCLASIYHNPPDTRFEVVVIDNASFDGCGEMLRTEFPEVKFVQNNTNCGFAAANNLAAECSCGKYLLFLNPDTEVTASAIDDMLAFLVSTPAAGAAGALLLNSDHSVQTSCVQSFPTILNQILDAEFLRARLPRLKMWGNEALLESDPRPIDVDMVSGACLMTSRSSFDAVCGFNAEYFMYAEDTEFCYRARQLGKTVYCVRKAVVLHHGGQSSGKASVSVFSAVMMRESMYRFFRTTRGPVYAAGYRLCMGVSAGLRVAILSLVFVFAQEADRKNIAASRRKWTAVGRWAVGLQKWAEQSGSKVRRPEKNEKLQAVGNVNAD